MYLAIDYYLEEKSSINLKVYQIDRFSNTKNDLFIKKLFIIFYFSIKIDNSSFRKIKTIKKVGGGDIYLRKFAFKFIKKINKVEAIIVIGGV